MLYCSLTFQLIHIINLLKHECHANPQDTWWYTVNSLSHDCMCQFNLCTYSCRCCVGYMIMAVESVIYARKSRTGLRRNWWRLGWNGSDVDRTGDKNIGKEIRCPESGGKTETESDGKVCNKRYLEKVGEEWRTAKDSSSSSNIAVMWPTFIVLNDVFLCLLVLEEGTDALHPKVNHIAVVLPTRHASWQHL